MPYEYNVWKLFSVRGDCKNNKISIFFFFTYSMIWFTVKENCIIKVFAMTLQRRDKQTEINECRIKYE